MNPQPFRSPPRWWPSRFNRVVVRLLAWRRNQDLRRQGIERIDVIGPDPVAAALQAGQGVLLVSNHSYHFDSFVLIQAGLWGNWHPQIMTAWQVFMMYRWFGRWSLQRHGCFSVNREGIDTQALRHAVSILSAGTHPLAIYPEGDIFHSNDRVMPFREGAAAIALLAARQQQRPIVAIPCAMKCFYTASPLPELEAMLSRLEQRIHWRPSPELPVIDRIYRFGSGFLALKEVEYLGTPQTGTIRQRIRSLSQALVEQVSQRRRLTLKGPDTLEQIRHLRAQLIRQTDTGRESPRRTEQELIDWHIDLEDLFFATQLCSYHGDYAAEKPSLERMAETIDKFEEDVFSLPAPTPRGKRRAVIQFGEPIPVTGAGQNAARLTLELEQAVQLLLEDLNRRHEQQILPA